MGSGFCCKFAKNKSFCCAGVKPFIPTSSAFDNHKGTVYPSASYTFFALCTAVLNPASVNWYIPFAVESGLSIFFP